jgi:hypothetical protein
MTTTPSSSSSLPSRWAPSSNATGGKEMRDGLQALAQHLLDLTEPSVGQDRTAPDATLGHTRAALGAVKGE